MISIFANDPVRSKYLPPASQYINAPVGTNITDNPSVNVSDYLFRRIHSMPDSVVLFSWSTSTPASTTTTTGLRLLVPNLRLYIRGIYLIELSLYPVDLPYRIGRRAIRKVPKWSLRQLFPPPQLLANIRRHRRPNAIHSIHDPHRSMLLHAPISL